MEICASNDAGAINKKKPPPHQESTGNSFSHIGEW
jgi:hypothetical protein